MVQEYIERLEAARLLERGGRAHQEALSELTQSWMRLSPSERQEAERKLSERKRKNQHLQGRV